MTSNLRYVLKLELIGDGLGGRYAGYMGRDHSRPWIARIAGPDDEFTFRREFIKCQKDYSHASGTGARGIFGYYALSSGVYEVNERLSWKTVKRYFLLVDGGEAVKISRDEVEQWVSAVSV